MSSTSNFPMGISEDENSLGLTTSKLFALTGSLLTIYFGIVMAGLIRVFTFVGIAGIFCIIFGLAIFAILFLNDLTSFLSAKLPYEWFILLGISIVLLFLNILSVSLAIGFAAVYGYIVGPLLLFIGGVVLLLKGLNFNVFDDKAIVNLFALIFTAIELIILAVNGAWLSFIFTIIALIILFLISGVVDFKLPENFGLEKWGYIFVILTLLIWPAGIAWMLVCHGFLLELIE